MFYCDLFFSYVEYSRFSTADSALLWPVFVFCSSASIVSLPVYNICSQLTFLWLISILLSQTFLRKESCGLILAPTAPARGTARVNRATRGTSSAATPSIPLEGGCLVALVAQTADLAAPRRSLYSPQAERGLRLLPAATSPWWSSPQRSSSKSWSTWPSERTQQSGL